MSIQPPVKFFMPHSVAFSAIRLTRPFKRSHSLHRNAGEDGCLGVNLEKFFQTEQEVGGDLSASDKDET